MRGTRPTSLLRGSWRPASRLMLGVALAATLVGGTPAAARAQTGDCDRVRLVDSISNVDLIVRCPSGEVRHIRIAGLDVCPEGWPLSDPDLNVITLSDRVANLVSGGPLLLGPALSPLP